MAAKKGKAASQKAAAKKNARRASAAPKPRIRLTAEVGAGGCACKLGPADLRQVLAGIPVLRDKNVLVATETSDDAGVYRLSSTSALVATVDFFPPMVDDPFVFGQVAAANALSDVYAMGGKPLVALGIVAFPAKKLPLSVLSRIIEGATDRVKKAGAVLIGGHSVMDDELKYGLAVTGTIHPKRIVRNGGARAGDLLVLTKSLGTGIISTAIKKQVAKPEEEAFAIASMIELNDVAGSMLVRYGAHACTDVTGFGLAGHATEMAEASGSVRFEIESAQLPLLPGTARLAEDGYVTGGAARNREWLGARLSIGKDVAPALAQAAVDPQTSGGLLVALPPKKAEDFELALHRKGLRPSIIGQVVPKPRGSRVVVHIS
ncbi:MAG TPA: selenide, water dikinase SelD [Candidatus Binatia bacterium]|jgi:selenide,water dikinase